MAASLLYLKSKLLLPQQSSYSPEEEAEALFFGSKEELVRSLLEYKRIKLIAAKLKEREEQQVRIFLRSAALPRVVIVNRQFSLYPHDPDILKDAWQQIKKRNVIKTKTVSLPEEIPFSRKLQDIISRIKQKGALNYYLDDFLEKKEKKEIVLTFFVLLELAKRGKISLQQRRIFGKISVLRPIIRK
jgi:segregation and condensation protein A